MKKQIIARIVVVACVALCAAVWPRSAEAAKAAVNAEIEARSEETPPIFISADATAPETEFVAESEPEVTETMAEKETEKSAPTQTVQSVKPTASS